MILVSIFLYFIYLFLISVEFCNLNFLYRTFFFDIHFCILKDIHGLFLMLLLGIFVDVYGQQLS